MTTGNSDQNGATRWERAGALLSIFIPFIIFLWRADAKLDGPLDHDELYWIGGSCELADLITSRPFSDPAWGLGPIREHPQLGRILVGLLLTHTGGCGNGMELLAIFYDRHRLDPRNDGRNLPERLVTPDNPIPRLSSGRIEQLRSGEPWYDPDLLRRGRLISATFGAFAILGIYLAGSRLSSHRAGVLAASAFALHPIAAGCYSTALIDMAAQTFAIYFFVVLMRCFGDSSAGTAETRRGARWTGILLAALLLACALGTKLVTLPIPVAAAGTAAFFHMAGRRARVEGYHRARDTIIAVLLLGGALFAATNAALYREPITGFVALIAHQQRLEQTADYMRQLSGLDLYLPTFAERLGAVARGSFGVPGMICVALAGVSLAVFRPRSAPVALLLSWWLATFAIVTVSIPFPWYRYFLPLIPPSVLILASALELLIRRVVKN